ncbi:hypothetical protein NUW58_g2812 [Xylaria curta]|uniref:Uncharacterized protein n=1 Tax=Xylaria curta TaxID=42375 RepID=A0ACC1PEB8_9PEZI|nr:hypothetical protein NUW58_g2812 [Xylaria curta]
MDPSSFASAAASLLGVTIQITGSLYGNWEYSSLVLAERLIYELSQLRNALQSLEATALSITDPFPRLASAMTLIQCTNSLTRKQASIATGRSYQRHPVSPSMSLQARQQSVFSSTEELLPQRIAHPTGALLEDRAEYVEFHETARKSRLDGTGRWFVANPKFQNWLTIERAPGTLFCTEKPGSMKTILTSLAIDSVQKWQKDNRSLNDGLAYFYFSYKTPRPLRNIALALLEQLHLQSPSLNEEVTKLDVLAAKEEHTPFSDIVSAVIAVSKKFQSAYIIIDALGECSPDYQKDLLYMLTSVRNSPARLLASRPHLTFDIFNDSPTIDIIPSKQDIILYEHFSLQDLLVYRDKLHEAIIDALLKTREFLPIVLQLNAVLSKATAKEILRELVEVPPGLYAVYRGLLGRVRGQEPHMVETAETTLT